MSHHEAWRDVLNGIAEALMRIRFAFAENPTKRRRDVGQAALVVAEAAQDYYLA